MTIKEAIEQLDELTRDSKSFLVNEVLKEALEDIEIYRKKIEALKKQVSSFEPKQAQWVFKSGAKMESEDQNDT